MGRRDAPAVDGEVGAVEGAAIGADGLPDRAGAAGRAPLFGRRSGRVFAGLVALAVVLALVAGALTAERAVDRLLYPPTITPEPTPDIAPLGPGYVQGPPTITVERIRRVLLSYNSPAVAEAQAFYDLGVARGIDPAWCLAFFIMESGAGTRGVARTTYSIGNIRALPGQPNYDGYRQYADWREGIADWYRLIDEVYIRDRGETTIDAIVPVYAPAFDSNDPDAYIRAVKRLVARWRGY